jgi:hypothetical protein
VGLTTHDANVVYVRIVLELCEKLCYAIAYNYLCYYCLQYLYTIYSLKYVSYICSMFVLIFNLITLDMTMSGSQNSHGEAKIRLT